MSDQTLIIESQLFLDIESYLEQEQPSEESRKELLAVVSKRLSKAYRNDIEKVQKGKLFSDTGL